MSEIAQIMAIDRDLGFDFTLVGLGRLQNGWRCHGIGKIENDREEVRELIHNHCGSNTEPEDIFHRQRNGKPLKIRTLYWVNPFNDDVIGIGLTEEAAVDDANEYLRANGYTLDELTGEA